jgi:hypothetical protein
MLELLKFIPIRFWEYSVLIVFILLGAAFYTEHERSIGRQQIEQEVAQSQQKMQDKVDSLSKETNAKIQAQYDAVKYDPIQLTLPVDCGSVPDDIKLRINQAHKANQGKMQ